MTAPLTNDYSEGVIVMYLIWRMTNSFLRKCACAMFGNTSEWTKHQLSETRKKCNVWCKLHYIMIHMINVVFFSCNTLYASATRTLPPNSVWFSSRNCVIQFFSFCLCFTSTLVQSKHWKKLRVTADIMCAPSFVSHHATSN